MAVINILKDGTVVDDMSKVTVPKETVQAIARIVERNEDEQQQKKRKCS